MRKDTVMSTEENKALVLRLLRILNEHEDLHKLGEVCASTIADYAAPPGTPLDLNGYTQTMAMLRTAFPDIHYEVEDLIAEGDRVVVLAVMTGTHQGSFMERVPATGNGIVMKAIHIFRIEEGKLVAHWAVRDDLSLFQQLGVVPRLQPTTA
jgi:predicted ester cyclase